MKCVVYHGNTASMEIILELEFNYLDENLRPDKKKPFRFNTLVTTYEVAIKDIVVLAKIHWRCLVVDEAHRLKNQSSRLVEIMRSIRRDHCVLLTDTPLQNKTEELWALLNFLNGKSFPSISNFLDKFGDIHEAQQVSDFYKMFKPYLLRRVKEDLEKPLHPKEETIVEVELTPVQKQWYRGHKVLIFSQMVRVLDIIEDYLRYCGYLYERLDGNIRGNDRQAAVDRFFKPEYKRFVMLFSTKSGGLGLNLTAADTVIIFDSDWNPQNDLQAQDRAHRIGQTHSTYEMHMFHKASLKLGLDKAVITHMRPSSIFSNTSSTEEADDASQHVDSYVEDEGVLWERLKKSGSPNTVVRHSMSGIPDAHRSWVWTILINLIPAPSDLPQNLAASNNEDENILDGEIAKSIENDIRRTRNLTDDQMVPMRLVLTAFANRNRRVGYCQGMNNILVILLQYLDENQALRGLTLLIEVLLPASHVDSMIVLHTDCAVMNTLLRQNDPELHAHLNE
ncbi:hypothetical protein PsorP6_002659 [Peronosclerospora sorghi]|uniref:Uncharacterized protein n=1 Tax=Peronosclerospora sorghi TaxID=230839 RepID=A0ACC0WS53_9STRA|nr:hypothetical protein PsorP6_002659 [Peronosclerospora sorghi]